MRIVAVLDRLAPLLRDRTHLPGGAEREALGHLRALAEQFGHRCHVLTPSPMASRVRLGELRLCGYRDLEELKQQLRRLRPVVVFSNLDLVYDAAELSRALGLPHVAWLDSFECAEPTAREKRRWGVSLDRRYLPAEKVAFALRFSRRVFAVSGALARRVRARHGIAVETLYPTFHADEMRVAPSDAARRAVPGRSGDDFDGGFITGVCGWEYKGARVFLELCRRFPRHAFLLAGHIDPRLKSRFARVPNLTNAALPTRTLLARSGIVVVPSQWEEPLGRIAIEAMTNGIPVLASWTGGLKEVVGRTPLAVRQFRDRAAWVAALRTLVHSPTARAANAATGRKRARRFLAASSAARLHRLIRGATRRATAPAPLTVAIVGNTSAQSAFALLNARLAKELKRTGELRVVACSTADATGLGAVDCFIHHDYAAEFARVARPSQGRWIDVRTWDFGAYPPAWSAKIRAESDRLWVYSRWSKALAMRSGIPAQRIAVVPWGIDPATFTPRGRRYALPTRRRFVFLFVGAAVYRKGLDILLDAYGRAFRRGDDVCLVVKSHPGDVFYRGIGMRERIAALRARRDHPEIVLIDRFCSAAALASLYRACDVGVFPYRAEGFALPILEAMACGLPSIVPAFGPCLDYCSPASSFRVPVRRVHLPVGGRFPFNTLGFEAAIEEVDFGEMPVDALAAEMRRVAELPAAVLRRKAAAGVRVSHGRFTWSRVVEDVRRELAALARRHPARRLASRRRACATAERQRAVAAELLAMRHQQR